MRWLLALFGIAALYAATGDEDVVIDRLIDEGVFDE